MKCLIFFITFVIYTITEVSAQVVYEPVNNNPVYEFLDELAALKVITLNSVVRPYSRSVIALKLSEAKSNTDKLNKRQLEDLNFYLKDYQFDLQKKITNALPAETGKRQDASFNLNPLSFRLNKEVYKLSIAPAIGSSFILNNNGNSKEVTAGGDMYGYLAGHIGYYANIIYNWQSQPMVNPLMFNTESGNSLNFNGNGSVENTEWRGGLSVGWKWGDAGIYKDRPVWGYGSHGTNIISGKAPSFPYVQLHFKPAKWIEFYCIDALLQSNVIDSSRSTFTQGSVNVKYHRKYMASNIITLTPWRGLDFSFGNSIFWSDVIKVGYLIPFNLYKSIDQTQRGTVSYTDNLNVNDDGHLFFTLSSRNIKHLHLFACLWIDDWVTSYVLDPKKHNCLSWKLGLELADMPVKNLSLNVESSINRPRVYQEYNPVNSYTNDSYNLGNYLQDDSWELFIRINYKPIRGLSVSASYNIAQRGGFQYMKDDYSTYPLSKNLVYNNTIISLDANYHLLTNLSLYMGFQYQDYNGDLQYIPEVFHGRTTTMILGMGLGI